MNNYPVWWDKTLTIYNKYESASGQVTWYRSVVTGCFWMYLHTDMAFDTRNTNTALIVCRIPKKDNYLPRYKWQELSAESRSSYFTITDNDIIVLGEVTDSIDEYTAGSRSNDLVNKYKKKQGCLTIESCQDNTGNLGCEHYNIRGF